MGRAKRDQQETKKYSGTSHSGASSSYLDLKGEGRARWPSHGVGRRKQQGAGAFVVEWCPPAVPRRELGALGSSTSVSFDRPINLQPEARVQVSFREERRAGI